MSYLRLKEPFMATCALTAQPKPMTGISQAMQKLLRKRQRADWRNSKIYAAFSTWCKSLCSSFETQRRTRLFLGTWGLMDWVNKMSPYLNLILQNGNKSRMLWLIHVKNNWIVSWYNNISSRPGQVRFFSCHDDKPIVRMISEVVSAKCIRWGFKKKFAFKSFYDCNSTKARGRWVRQFPQIC